MLNKENIKDIYPLSPLQAGMFFHALFDASSPAYFEQLSYRLRGELSIPHVEQSLHELMKRYDILRTVFVQKGSHDPIQVVLKERKADFRFLDISGREEKEAYIDNYKAGDRKNLFDLGKDVLMRVAVIRAAEQDHEFIWSSHHILMDGWCTSILVADFFEIYNSSRENRPPQLKPVIPYRTYIDWLERQDKDEARNYWRRYLENYETLTGVPRLKLLKFHKNGEIGYKKGKFHFDLESEKTTALETLAGENNVTLSTIFQVVWAIILGRYNDKRDVVFGVVVSGRPTAIKGVETIVGLFINTVPERIEFEDKTFFRQLLQKVRDRAVEGAPYHYSQLAEIQSENPLKQDLLDHIMVFENYPLADRIEGLNCAGTGSGKGVPIEVSRMEAFEQTNYDFNLTFGPGERLSVNIEYNANAYDDNYIERVAGHLNNVLEQILNDEVKEITIEEITLISPGEKKQLLMDFNSTETEYPFEKVIQQLFEEQAVKTPHNTAVVFSDQCITYGTLNRGANRQARQLRGRGVGPGCSAALLLEPSLETVTAIAAVLKAGGIFVPLDPDSPYERNHFILEDIQPSAVLIQEKLLDQNRQLLQGFSSGSVFPIHGEGIYTEEREAEGIAKWGDVDLEIINTAEDTAFALYTSGTTGRPKGILLTHRNVHNYILGLQKRVFGRYGDRLAITSLAPYTFDGYGQFIFCALWHGRRFCVLPAEYRFDGARILEFYSKYNVDISNGTPAHIRLMVGGLKKNTIGLCLKNLLIAGEVLPKKVVKQFLNSYPVGAAVPVLTNCYGPTECCGDTTHYTIFGENIDLYETFPIGTPLPNTRVYILDSKMRMLPLGIFGELCIGGDGVALGYLNKPELTAEAFEPLIAQINRTQKRDINKSFSGGQGGRLYKKAPLVYHTGDLGRWLPGGNIEFLGRVDHQVKLRGYRIELGEIEVQLMNHEHIKAVVVTAGGEDDAGRYLCAYYVSAPDAGIPSASELREYLAQQLPAYMVPTYFVPMELMPLKTNGKVDRKALPDPMNMSLSSGVCYIAPRNETEEKIAAIWAEVLKREVNTIGIHDNFFELGGNSINILKIAARIHSELKLEVTVSVLFLYPTIAEIVAHIHEQEMLSRLECIVKLNNGKNKKNIFILHPYHGMVYQYRELAKLLEADYNVYGIQARGLVRNSRLPETAEMLVADYIHQIMQIQPEAPYIIAGFCFGSIVAYEIVNRLEALNHPVQKLILFDEHAIIPPWLIDYFHSRRWKMQEVLYRLPGFSRKNRVEAAARDYVREVNLGVVIHIKEAGVLPCISELPKEMEQRKKRIDENNKKLEQVFHISGIIKAPILDIKAEASSGAEFAIERLAPMSNGGFTLIEVPGDHNSIFTQPYVKRLAEIIADSSEEKM